MMPTGTQAFTSLFASASLIVAFFGGMIMLFAPCCITLMLPAYLGTVFKEKSKVMLMTLVFAAGVASIMLPLVLGARFLASFFSTYHFFVFAFGSLLMIGVGFMSLFDKTIPIPFVSKLQAPRATNAASAYVLGVISGISSTCCAPVLFGALTLAALSPTMLQAAGVGFAYTFGIVFPLFILSFFIEKELWKLTSKLRKKTLTFGTFTVVLSNFLSFVIFTATGTLFLILAMTNRLQMNEGTVDFAIKLKSWVDIIAKPLNSIPYSNVIFGIILLGVLIYFIRMAIYANKKAKKKDN